MIDTHAHYDDGKFDEDRDELLGSMLKEGGIEIVVNIAADMSSVRTTDELTKKYDHVYGALGVHPEGIEDIDEKDMEMIEGLISKNRKIRAVGEIGFDLSEGYPDKELQEKWFRRQILLAKKTGLPIVVHSRDAASDTYRVLSSEYEKTEGKINGVVHCFSYSYEEALKYTKIGFFIGVGGAVTFKNGRKLKEAAKEVPLEYIVLETDSPYLCPEPFRGKRNSSLYIPYIVKAIAGIKDISEEEVCRKTTENAKRLYGI